MFNNNNNENLTSEQFQSALQFVNANNIDATNLTKELQLAESIQYFKTHKIPQYDLYQVAHFIFVRYNWILDTFKDEEIIEDLQRIIDVDIKFFVEVIHDSEVIEQAIQDGLIAVTKNEEWNVLFNYFVPLYAHYETNAEADKIVTQVYEEVYDKIADKINDIARPYVVYYCEQEIARRKQINAKRSA